MEQSKEKEKTDVMHLEGFLNSIELDWGALVHNIPMNALKRLSDNIYRYFKNLNVSKIVNADISKVNNMRDFSVLFAWKLVIAKEYELIFRKIKNDPILNKQMEDAIKKNNVRVLLAVSPDDDNKAQIIVEFGGIKIVKDVSITNNKIKIKKNKIGGKYE